jgi:hypothetical protein
MLYLWRLLSTDACTPPLKRAILANGLVNPRGRPDGFQAIDFNVETLNCVLKLLITDRRNGTFGVDELFQNCVLTLDYAVAVKKTFELPFGHPSRGRHQEKDATKDIRHLADLIFIEGSISRKDGRSCAHKSLNLFGNGINVIMSGAVSKFNEQLLERRNLDTDVDGDAGNRSATVECVENITRHMSENDSENK